MLGGVALVWAVSLFCLYVAPGAMNALAIIPRRVDALHGILTAPLVHGSFAHLTANTGPLLVLGGMVASRGTRYFLRVTLAIAVLGGLALWALGREAAHIGASGVIFGYFGFLIGRGYYRRRPGTILAAVAVAFLYGGGMLAGIVPQGGQVSWEGHLFGLLAGGLCARFDAGGNRDT